MLRARHRGIERRPVDIFSLVETESMLKTYFNRSMTLTKHCHSHDTHNRNLDESFRNEIVQMVSSPKIVDEKVECIPKESSFLSNDETSKWNRNETKDSSDRVESISSDADDVASIWFHPTMSRTNRFSLCSSSLINRCDRLNSFVSTDSESSLNWIPRDQQSVRHRLNVEHSPFRCFELKFNRCYFQISHFNATNILLEPILSSTWLGKMNNLFSIGRWRTKINEISFLRTSLTIVSVRVLCSSLVAQWNFSRSMSIRKWTHQFLHESNVFVDDSSLFFYSICEDLSRHSSIRIAWFEKPSKWKETIVERWHFLFLCKPWSSHIALKSYSKTSIQ